ncbi:MAG TPA: BatA domain-containing protein [Bacteroidota bacterium]
MTFLNPLVLFGLAAAAIPILIHLLNLRKLRTIEFSSLRFLKELQRSSIRRLRIRQWILLAIRTLLIAALVLAFSRPALKGSFANLIGGRAATTMVVLMDDSPSMTVRSQEGVLFNQARGAATKLASLLKEGDQMFLLPLSEIRHKDQFASLRTREAAVQAIGALAPSQERLMFRDALRAAGRLLTASSNPNQEVYLITDAQATQFGPDKGAVDTASPSTRPSGSLRVAREEAGPEGASQLDARTRLFLVRTTAGSLQNAGVVSAEVTTRIITRGRPAELRAVIRNAGPAPAAGAVAGMYLDGARVMQQTVDLPAGGSAAMTGKFVPRRSGVLAGSVQIEDDALEADNRRFFTLTVPERINVLLVGTSAADTRFVNLGLTLQGDSTLAGLFAVKTIGDTELPGVDLAAVDVIVLCDVRGFSSAGAEQLTRFVKAGGGLVIFPGSQADIPSYNETLFAKLGMPPAGPIVGTPAVNAGDAAKGARFSFEKVDMAHPLFSGMFEQQAGRPQAPRGQGGNRTATIVSPHVFATLTPGIGPQGHAVLTLSNGAGFLVEYPSGSGRVLLYSVEAGVTWSDFPMQGLFAPLLYRSVLYVAARDQNAKSFVVGEPIECVARLRGTVSSEPFVLTSPSGVEERVVPDYRGTSALAVFRSAHATEAGVYELRRGAPQGSAGQQVLRREPALAAVAVNVDSAESDLRPADDARIQQFWASLGAAPGQTAVFAASQELDASVEHSRYGVELWKHFLALALALAMAEMVIGRGRHGEIRTD